jgi:hypothetical protein
MRRKKNSKYFESLNYIGYHFRESHFPRWGKMEHLKFLLPPPSLFLSSSLSLFLSPSLSPLQMLPADKTLICSKFQRCQMSTQQKTFCYMTCIVQ